jgi:hypothetical protein
MSNKHNALNLDEIFGLGQKIKVIWQEKEYELPRPEAFSARSWAGFSSLQDKIPELQAYGENITDEQAQELETVADDCVRFLSPKLAAAGLPFFAKVQVLKFYGDQVNPGEAEKNPPGSQTGETSSAGSDSGTG